MVEFSSDVRLKDIVVRDPEKSAAVDDPVRAAILDILSEEEMKVGDVHGRLVDRDIERSENTVRHHVNRLRDAGLVEVARLEEGRGGTTKYYKANTVVVSYTVPEGMAETVEEVVDDISPEVGGILDALEDRHGGDIDSVVESMADCEHCASQKKREFLVLTILRRALVREMSDDA